jgi:hypothetical protein
METARDLFQIWTRERERLFDGGEIRTLADVGWIGRQPLRPLGDVPLDVIRVRAAREEVSGRRRSRTSSRLRRPAQA